MYKQVKLDSIHNINIIQHTHKKSKKTKSLKYQFMSKYHPTSWILIPILKTDYYSIDRVEKVIIKTLNPPLNKTYSSYNYNKYTSNKY